MGSVAGLIVRPWSRRRPGGVSAARDYAVVRFNRRPQSAGEGGLESIMYGDCSRADFQRFEGGSYSSKPASTVCRPEGGDALVERTLETIDAMF